MFARKRSASSETPRTLAPGTVTRLVAQQHDAERVSVYLDDAFAFGVHRDLVLEHGLRKGLMLDVAAQDALVAADRRLRARSTALGFLAHRARTRREVADRLRRDDHPDDVIDEVLVWLDERSLLDDAAYAKQYAESRQRSQGYGPARVRQELARRGVAKADAEEAVSETFDPDDVAAMAREQAEKRLPQVLREPDRQKRRRKLFDFLVRRGFPYDVAGETTEAVLREADAADSED
ncbi:MAG: RecX family transcriptional regulator [Rhodothermales bacterium]|nr:RecX family transcriptional regulator [Rhodothermales bacterium]